MESGIQAEKMNERLPVFGFERVLMYVNGLNDVFLTDVFKPVVDFLEKASNTNYAEDLNATKAIRIIATRSNL